MEIDFAIDYNGGISFWMKSNVLTVPGAKRIFGVMPVNLMDECWPCSFVKRAPVSTVEFLIFSPLPPEKDIFFKLQCDP